MRITVNGQPEEIEEGATVEDLVARAGLTGTACAVELNRQIIPKARRSERRLEEGDVVEMVTLIGGG